ncbi:MAG: hypothetical protein MMC33_002482 [Icmadophila ericetorum]|nr:hypothetical protein [Icmadophila ericetorum]
MAESTPLLPRANKGHHDAPIFARVCHSPWSSISQQSLMVYRGLIAVFMIVIGSMSLDHAINHTEHGGQVFPFVASNVSWVMQTIYHIITCIWTTQQVTAPKAHHSNERSSGYAVRSQEEESGNYFIEMAKGIFKIPRNTFWNGTVFTMFYTCVTTFPFVITFMHWFVLDGANYKDHGPFTNFLIFNRNTVNSFIALIEIFILSSVRKQLPVGRYVAGLNVVCLAYFGWFTFGEFVTGRNIYKMFDPQHLDGRSKFLYICVTNGITSLMYIVQFGMHDLREYLTSTAAGGHQGR